MGRTAARSARYRVQVHLDTDGGWLTAAPAAPPVIDGLTCDGTLTPVWETDGHPVNVGRAQRVVPHRTRVLVLDRDRGCRSPAAGAPGTSRSTTCPLARRRTHRHHQPPRPVPLPPRRTPPRRVHPHRRPHPTRRAHLPHRHRAAHRPTPATTNPAPTTPHPGPRPRPPRRPETARPTQTTSQTRAALPRPQRRTPAPAPRRPHPDLSTQSAGACGAVPRSGCAHPRRTRRGPGRRSPGAARAAARTVDDRGAGPSRPACRSADIGTAWRRCPARRGRAADLLASPLGGGRHGAGTVARHALGRQRREPGMALRDDLAGRAATRAPLRHTPCAEHDRRRWAPSSVVRVAMHFARPRRRRAPSLGIGPAGAGTSPPRPRAVHGRRGLTPP